MMAASAMLAAALFVSMSHQNDTRSVFLSPSQYVTLNGRTNIWRSQIGEHSGTWMFGRGVGAVGTASERAQRSLVGRIELDDRADRGGHLVDSGYFTAVADVGIVGLVVLLGILVRIGQLAVRATRRGDPLGWGALGVLSVVALDAVTRESLTAFPNAYVSMLVLGLAVATWHGRSSRTTPHVLDRAS
jgi:hypothetical protein